MFLPQQKGESLLNDLCEENTVQVLSGEYEGEFGKIQSIDYTTNPITYYVRLLIGHTKAYCRLELEKVPEQKGGRTTDSLDWSKKYEVLTISRLDLRSYGLTIEQINSLSDEDMEAIAEELYHRYDLNNFGEDVVFVTLLLLAEKREGDMT